MEPSSECDTPSGLNPSPGPGPTPAPQAVRVPVQIIDGFPFPQLFDGFKIRQALTFKVKPHDIVSVGYPKTGTTWLRYILWSIRNAGALPLPSRDELNVANPFIDRMGTEGADQLTTRRHICTHLNFNFIDYNPRAKYIYIARNPADTAVSYYHYSKEIVGGKGYNASFNDYFEQFITGQVPYGDYFDNLFSWYRHDDRPNVRLLCYEELLTNAPETVLNISKFISDSDTDYFQVLSDNNGHLLNQVVDNTKFSFMREMPVELTDENQEKVVVNFWRKGAAGDWKSYFDEDKMERLSHRMRDKLREWNVDEAKFMGLWYFWFN